METASIAPAAAGDGVGRIRPAPARNRAAARTWLRRSARAAVVFFLIGLVLSWLGATFLSWTVDPRFLSPDSSGESWRAPHGYAATKIWDLPLWTCVETVRQRSYKRPWGPEQATGMPNTPAAGDTQTAWASLAADGHAEWLAVRWSRPVMASEINVYQSLNPATARVKAGVMGGEVTVWERPPGTKWGPAPENKVVVLTVPLDPPREVSSVTLEIDSLAVQGWNEIDAVCLREVGEGGASTGRLVGADDAAASSTYAERTAASPAGGPFPGALWKGAAPGPPRWSGLAEPSAAYQRGELDIEGRTACAFGWPMRAWVARTTWVKGKEGPVAPAPAAVSGASGAPAAQGSLLAAGGGAIPGAMMGVRPMQALPWRARVLGLAVDSALYGGALWLVLLAFTRPIRIGRRVLRMQRGKCPQCGYDLRFNFAGGCSECGFLKH